MEETNNNSSNSSTRAFPYALELDHVGPGPLSLFVEGPPVGNGPLRFRAVEYDEGALFDPDCVAEITVQIDQTDEAWLLKLLQDRAEALAKAEA
jgi:hypothetical protein